MYTIEKATLITEQLKRFTTGYTHHVVGQFANIDFWMNEVLEAISAIDEHIQRFDNMYNAQKEWTIEHGTVVHEYCPICRGRCEFSDGKPTLPRLKHKRAKVETRKELVNTTYYFLARCYRIGLLSNEELKSLCDSIGTSIDPNDLK